MVSMFMSLICHVILLRSTGGHLRGLQEAVAETLRRQRLKGRKEVHHLNTDNIHVRTKTTLYNYICYPYMCACECCWIDVFEALSFMIV